MPPRQRLALPTGLATTAGRRIQALVGLALLYGGGVVLALAAGVAPDDLDAWTGYRTAYDELAGLQPADWSDAARIAVAVAGVVLFLVLLRLAWAQRVVPHRERTALTLTDDELGRTTVSPRAVERAAELAARRTGGVHAATARLGDDELTLTVHTRAAEQIPDLLRDAQRRVRDALETSGVPQTTVRVLVTRYSAPSTREQLR